jgi:shikimate dehydrogenase
MTAFSYAVSKFFSEGGYGANITLPFKKQAWGICDELSERAIVSGVVNTIKKMENGLILGDNTDGSGFISDLECLGIIKPYIRVLLIGAGGAAYGIIPMLLESQCLLTITNRSTEKVKELCKHFRSKGYISSLHFRELYNKSFDLVINATSSSLTSDIPLVPPAVCKHACCYDLTYQNTLTSFLRWSHENGAELIVDGLGMLVRQAAHSFYIWHNIMPEVPPTLKQLRYHLSQLDYTSQLDIRTRRLGTTLYQA